MSRYVIDTPTLLHLADEGLSVIDRHQLVAPNWIRSDALDSMLRDVRDGIRTEKAALEAHEQVTAIKMRLLGDRASRRLAWRIALQHDITTLKDAEYMALVKLQADALVTVDAELEGKADGVVAVAPLRSLFTA